MKPYESEDIIISRQPEPTFFLDRTTDNPTVLNGLRSIGCSVIPHRHLFKHDEDDLIWIEHVTERGWTIITNDKGIRHNELEIKAVIVFKARMLCLTNGNMNPETIVDVLRSGMNLIRKFIQTHEPPYIVRVRRGDGRRQRVTLNRLKLPLERYLP